MKINVLQEDLTKAISICSRFSSNRVQLPVLANILLETSENKLRVVSTNLEVSVSISIGAKITEEGSITVPARIISDLVSNLKQGQLTLTSVNESLTIASEDFESTVSGMNASDFPAVANSVGAESYKIPYDVLHDSLSKVLFAVSSDETRPTLTGVLMIMRASEVYFVGTDGFRLSQKKNSIKGSDEEKRIIIPKNTLAELSRLHGGNEVEFSYKKADNQIIFSSGNIVMASRVIDGEFPDFEKIIPKNTAIKVNADKEELLRKVKLASVFAKDAANVIKLKLNKENLEITAESQQYGNQKGKVDAKIEGKIEGDFVIAFNYHFVEEFLGAVEGDSVQVEFTDPGSPSLFIDPEDTEYLHIIMPVRLQS